MRTPNYNISLAILTKWLVPHYRLKPEVKEVILNWITFYDNWLSRIYLNNGLAEMISHSKMSRLLVLRYLAGDPLYSSTVRLRIRKDGLPFTVKRIVRLLQDGDPQVLRLIVTVLNLTKSIDDKSVPVDFRPITDAPRFDPNVLDDLKARVPSILLTQFRLKPGDILCNHREYHFSAKSAPNGGPALGSCMDELSLIFSNPQLYKDLGVIGGQVFKENLNMIRIYWNDAQTDPDTKTLRKVFVVQDKEAKSRIVAILDYWSQTVLKTLHDSVFSSLRKIESDMTHDQSSFVSYIEKYKPKKFWCYDLSNATDRFPLELQKAVLKYFLGEDTASSWCNILTGLDYVYSPSKIQSENISLKYRAGQPMGAFSSWPVFALSHHVVVAAAAQISQQPLRGSYVLLGDDIVIFNEAIAKVYLRLMSGLGVEISHSKSICSERLCSFAARYMYLGKEISPFSLRGVHESIRSASELAELFKTMRRNGWSEYDLDVTPGSLLKLVELVDSKSFRKKTIATQAHFLYNVSIKDILESGLVKYPLSETLDCHSPMRAYQKLADMLHLVYLEDYAESTLKKVKVVENWFEDQNLQRFFRTELIKLHPGVLPELLSVLPFYGVQESISVNFYAAYWKILGFGSPEHTLKYEDLQNYRSLNIVPDVSIALKKRNHIAVTHTQSNLLIKTVHLCRTQGIISYAFENIVRIIPSRSGDMRKSNSSSSFYPSF